MPRASRLPPSAVATTVAALAALVGWALVTYGVAQVAGRLAYVFSAGLLLLSCFGWRLLFTVARDGLYVLSQQGKPRG